VTVHKMDMYSPWGSTFAFLTGQYRLLDASDVEITSTGTVAFSTAGEGDAAFGPISGVRSVVFEGITWNSIEPCFGDLLIWGTAP